MNSRFLKCMVLILALAISACGGSSSSSSSTSSSQLVGITVDSTTAPTTLYVSDYGLDTIKSYNITSGAATTLAGQSGSSGDANANGTSASFSGPEGLAIVGSTLYIADSNNYGVRYMALASPYAVSTKSGLLGTQGNLDDATALLAEFGLPRNMVADSTGTYLYITDQLNAEVRQITIASGAVNTIANGLTSPFGIAIDSLGNLYVSDSAHNSIYQIAAGTWNTATGALGTVKQIAGSATGLSGYPTNLSGTSARFNTPLGLTIDASNNLYVVDSGNNAIQKVTTAGATTLIAGSSAGSYGSTNASTGTSALFYEPINIVYANGNLYVVDQGGTSIRIISTTSPYAVSNLP
jgi:NHL repeat